MNTISFSIYYFAFNLRFYITFIINHIIRSVNPHERPLVNWSVGWLASPVCHNFLRMLEVTLPCSYQFSTPDIIKNKGHLWRIKGSRFVFQKFPSKFWTVNGIPTCTAMKLNVCTVGVSCFKCLPGHLATYTLKVQSYWFQISNPAKRDIIW